MSDDLTIRTSAVETLDPSLTTLSESKNKKNSEIGKEEFLTMLVAQLKNQDPLDPMSNEDFAVNLAQFSQLEQLIDINNKIGGSAGGSESLAGYLGHEVVIDSSVAQVKNGDGGKVQFQLDTDASNVSIDLLNADGTVRETKELGAMEAGSHTVALSDLDTQSGDYAMQVNVISTTGMAYSPQGYVAGIVSGFVPGTEPVLLVDGREVSLAEIKEVRVPAAEDTGAAS